MAPPVERPIDELKEAREWAWWLTGHVDRLTSALRPLVRFVPADDDRVAALRSALEQFDRQNNHIQMVEARTSDQLRNAERDISRELRRQVDASKRRADRAETDAATARRELLSEVERAFDLLGSVDAVAGDVELQEAAMILNRLLGERV